MSELIDAVRVGAALVGLAYAATTDVKTREVPDWLWFALGGLGLALFALDLNQTYGGASALLALPVALVFAVAVLGGEFIEVVKGEGPLADDYKLNDEERGRLRIDLVLTALCLAAAFLVFFLAAGLDLGPPAGLLQGPQVQAYVVVVMFGLTYLLYMFSMIAGGADAKCLMTLAVMFPVAPAIAGLPLVHPPAFAVLAVPFALAAFFNGAILLVVLRLPVSPVVSARRGEFRAPDAFFGVPKKVAEVNLDREWVLGRVVEGQWKRALFPRHGSHSEENQKGALEFLKAKGQGTVFVSPKFPFMVYLVIGFVAVLVVSCPLYFVGGLR